jgi:UDP-N-acetylglucosamine 2-epimerase
MYYLTFKKIVENFDIKVIYLESLGGFYETLLLGVAYRLNRKVVYSPHGYGDRYFIVRDVFLKNVYFAAWGWGAKKRLRNLGIKEENIFITGSPLFDKIAKYKSKRKKHKTGKIITLITQPLVEDGYVGKREYFKYIQKFLAQIVKIKNVAQIIIKLHPREKYRSNYESIVKSLGLKNVIITQEPGKEALYTVLSKSDLVLSTGSTADIEGMMLDKNVIVVDGLAKGFLAELSKKDKYREAVYEINKNDDLTDAITRILINRDLQKKLAQARRKYLAGSFYKIDGKAHERVATLILRLIKREKE